MSCVVVRADAGIVVEDVPEEVAVVGGAVSQLDVVARTASKSKSIKPAKLSPLANSFCGRSWLRNSEKSSGSEVQSS